MFPQWNASTEQRRKCCDREITTQWPNRLHWPFWCVDNKNNAEKKHYKKWHTHTHTASSRSKNSTFYLFAYLNDGKIALSFCLYKASIKIDWPWPNCSISFTLVSIFFWGVSCYVYSCYNLKKSTESSSLLMFCCL